MWHALHAALQNVSRLVWERNWRSAEVPLPCNRSSNPLVTLLCVLAEEQDCSLITDLCKRNQWEAFFATTREEAERVLQKLKPQIILFDRDMAGLNWRELVTCFAAASPRACILLVSKVFDDYLWNELVSNGGYEVLRKPLREDEVTRGVRMAWSYWSSASRRASSSKR
jgi:DNA-binding NtrC family response regulator